MIITAVIGGNSGTGSVGADITVPLFIVTFRSVPDSQAVSLEQTPPQ
jgi:hypothetical protein